MWMDEEKRGRRETGWGGKEGGKVQKLHKSKDPRAASSATTANKRQPQHSAGATVGPLSPYIRCAD